MSAIVLFNQQKIRDRHKRDTLIEAFRRADKNGDGRLSVDEVYGIYVEHGVEVTREEVQRMVDIADKDGTGLLTEKEFVNSPKAGEVVSSRSSSSSPAAVREKESERKEGESES